MVPIPPRDALEGRDLVLLVPHGFRDVILVLRRLDLLPLRVLGDRLFLRCEPTQFRKVREARPPSLNFLNILKRL